MISDRDLCLWKTDGKGNYIVIVYHSHCSNVQSSYSGDLHSGLVLISNDQQDIFSIASLSECSVLHLYHTLFSCGRKTLIYVSGNDVIG